MPKTKPIELRMNSWSNRLVPLSDPSASEVFYLLKYFQIFPNFF